jgi:hypothetical protein
MNSIELPQNIFIPIYIAINTITHKLLHNITKSISNIPTGTGKDKDMKEAFCLPDCQYNKELLILDMIPAKFPGQK